MRIDHVIYATADLVVATSVVEAALGVPVQAGGRHEGQGTHNRIVPLGGGYLELLAIADRDEAAGSQFGALVLERTATVGEGLIAWAVSVDDVTPVANRLHTDVFTVSRDGLTAQVTGVLEALRDPLLPFFVAREDGIPDPGASGSAGGIEWLELAGDPARLRDWLGGDDVPGVTVLDGPSALRAVRVAGRELRTIGARTGPD